MALGLVILRWRCLETSAPQLVCSSTAIALILQPDLLSHIGFTLSVVATVLICTLAMDSGGRRAWAVYLALGFFYSYSRVSPHRLFFLQNLLVGTCSQHRDRLDLASGVGTGRLRWPLCVGVPAFSLSWNDDKSPSGCLA